MARIAFASLVLLVPALLAWRVRRLAAHADTATVGHALWRLHTHAPLAVACGWLVAYGVCGAAFDTDHWLVGYTRMARWMALFALPPAAAMFLAAAIARPALARLTTDDWPGVDVFARAPWRAAAWLTAGVVAAVTVADLATAPPWMSALRLLAAAVFAVVFAMPGESFVVAPRVPWAEGGLLDRLRTLAAPFRGTVERLELIRSPTRRAEVLPLPGKGVALTVPLVRDFRRDAVEALVLHRLAHRPGRPRLTFDIAFGCGSYLAAVTVVIAAVVVIPWAARWVDPAASWPVAVAAVVGLTVLSGTAASRGALAAADRRAAEAVPPDVLFAALAEQERLRGEPPDRDWLEDAFLFRASVVRRVGPFAEREGWPAETVAEVLSGSAAAGSGRYEMPVLPAERARPASRGGTLWVYVLLIGPPLAAAMVAERVAPGIARTAVLAAGAAAAVPIFLVGVAAWPARARAVTVRTLGRRLTADGINAATLGGLPVALAPDADDHMYGTDRDWDVGYLLMDAGRLLFLGDGARFALPRDLVHDVTVRPGTGWWKSSRVVLALADGRAISVWPAGHVSRWRLRRAVAALGARLQSWHRGDVSAAAPTAAVADLPPPNFEGVTGTPLAAVHGFVQTVVTCLTLVVLGTFVAGLAGLPFSPRELRGGVYVCAVASATYFVIVLPHLILRRTGSGGTTDRSPSGG